MPFIALRMNFLRANSVLWLRDRSVLCLSEEYAARNAADNHASTQAERKQKSYHEMNMAQFVPNYFDNVSSC